MLRFPPGVGRAASQELRATVQTVSAGADLGILSIVGTVLEPRISSKKGCTIWQCTLAQTHIGKGGGGGPTVDTQLLELRCIGKWATFASSIERGRQVAVVGKLLHRPKFVASTASYDHRSEVLISDTLGSLVTL